ncbi:hypothetical protein SAMN05428970_1996 [Agromyces sp. CF514]|uniref:hypothetical protein n=1 Tax=Agromyces sp. CF514 TaxID=1881031 RepID=UPI0008E90E0B|nr:hypothetical protein [Agromyces sp. CF514]SFR75964.1 hypothetical protein SAMN05428970_1996 [Agromyces sp. CF514]
MPKDDRLYGRFTLDFADSPKIAPLSDIAFRTLVEMTLHSRRMLDDGFVDARIVAKKWKKKAVDELCINDTEKPSLIRVDGGFRIHDFAEHQQTRADIDKKREAGRAGGLARAQAHAKADAQAPSKLLTETETETPSSTKKENTPASRGSRLDPSWLPSADDVAKIKSECPDVDPQREHAVFVDYWVAVPGTKGIKRDWSATWRNWMRRKQSDSSGRRPSPSEKARRTVMLATDLVGELEA